MAAIFAPHPEEDDTWKRYFLDHPRSVEESYGEHMASALYFARHLFGASLACLVHAFFPALFQTTGSSKVKVLHDRMITHRRRTLSSAEETGPGHRRDEV